MPFSKEFLNKKTDEILEIVKQELLTPSHDREKVRKAIYQVLIDVWYEAPIPPLHRKEGNKQKL